MARVRSETANSLRECLGYLLDEAMEHDMNFVALHIKLAMIEADDIVQRAIRKEVPKSIRGGNGAGHSQVPDSA